MRAVLVAARVLDQLTERGRGLERALFELLVFPTVANSVVNAVGPDDIGIASGTSSAMREVGGVFGVALAASFFSAGGVFSSSQVFVGHFRHAFWVAASLSAVGALVALFSPGRAAAARDTVIDLSCAVAVGAILRETPLPPLDEIVGRLASAFENMVRIGDPVCVTAQGWGVRQAPEPRPARHPVLKRRPAEVNGVPVSPALDHTYVPVRESDHARAPGTSGSQTRRPGRRRRPQRAARAAGTGAGAGGAAGRRAGTGGVSFGTVGGAVPVSGC